MEIPNFDVKLEIKDEPQIDYEEEIDLPTDYFLTNVPANVQTNHESLNRQVTGCYPKEHETNLPRKSLRIKSRKIKQELQNKTKTQKKNVPSKQPIDLNIVKEEVEIEDDPLRLLIAGCSQEDSYNVVYRKEEDNTLWFHEQFKGEDFREHESLTFQSSEQYSNEPADLAVSKTVQQSYQRKRVKKRKKVKHVNSCKSMLDSFNSDLLKNMESDENRLQCKQCDERFDEISHLNVHIMLVHTGDEGRYHCSQCGKRFNMRVHFSKHTINCHKSRAHQCNKCEKSFRNKSHLIVHKVQAHSRDLEQSNTLDSVAVLD